MGLFSGIGDAAGSMIGSWAARKDEKKREKALREALKELQGTNVEVGDTEFNNIQTDPAMRKAQVSALTQLQAEGNAGGLSVADRAAQQEAQTAAAQQARSQQDALRQEMQLRGGAGSGSEYGAALVGQQGQAQRSAMVGTQFAAEARRRALASTTQAGELGGQVHQQDYNEAANRAQANDEIAKFNSNQRFDKARTIYGAQSQQAEDIYGRRAQRKRDMGGALGRGVGAGADTYFKTDTWGK